MQQVAKWCLFFVRLWHGLARRVNTLYYMVILGKLGPRSVVTPKVFITCPYNVFIGEDVHINQFAVLQATPKAHIRIGNRVHISYGAMVLTATASVHKGWYSEHEYASVVIEDDVVIYSGAIVLPGIKIGTMSIIAAGAVVTHDVEPCTLVARIPAKVIKSMKHQGNDEHREANL